MKAADNHLDIGQSILLFIRKVHSHLVKLGNNNTREENGLWSEYLCEKNADAWPKAKEYQGNLGPGPSAILLPNAQSAFYDHCVLRPSATRHDNRNYWKQILVVNSRFHCISQAKKRCCKSLKTFKSFQKPCEIFNLWKVKKKKKQVM